MYSDESNGNHWCADLPTKIMAAQGIPDLKCDKILVLWRCLSANSWQVSPINYELQIGSFF